MLGNLRQISLSAGTGENHFTMSRGSFRYRQQVRDKSVLERREVIEKPDGFEIIFKKGDNEIVFSAAEQNGLIRAEITPRGDIPYNRFKITFPVDKDLHFYGCGEYHSAFDLKGEKVRIFVAEHQNTSRIGKKLIKSGLGGKKPQSPEENSRLHKYESYYAQPTFVTSGKWFFHAQTNGYSEFDFTTPEEVTFRAQEPFVFWIGQADSYAELSGKLADLIGHQPSLPDWIYDGAILAIQEGTDAVEKRLARAEEAGAKVCGIWSQDWCGCRRTGFGYQVMWNWEWDRALYPDLDRKIIEWKERGIRFLGYINPFMAIEKDLYKYASEKGYCVKNKDGEDYLVTITTFPAAMIDLTNPDAWEWYKNVIKENMIGLGLGGWMADFGEYLPVDCVLSSGEDPQMLHNRWPAMWAKLNHEAIEEAGAGGEVFFFTRAGYTGTSKYSPMMWAGDQHVDWSFDDGMASVIPATLSLAMSGFGITHSDIGGYTTVSKMTRSRELLIRWEEMNTFSPLFRFHEGNQPSRNVQFDADEELLGFLSRWSNIHAGLKPYLRELEQENSQKGIPVIRPLFYHCDEEEAYGKHMEYLLGRDILVAPVLKKGSQNRHVWLPDDRWVHIFTEEEYSGGSFEVNAPAGVPPVFIRKDSRYYDMVISLCRNPVNNTEQI